MSATIAVTNVLGRDSWASPKGYSTNEDARIRNIAAECREHNVDIAIINECETYQNSQVFAKAMGWGDRLAVETSTGKIKLHEDASCICKGEGGVAMGFAWNPDVFQWFQLKLELTYPGWARNRYSLAGRGRLEGKKTGLAAVHFEFMPYGKNNTRAGRRYNEIRYEQMDCLLDRVKLPGQSWIVGGDENHASKDKPDWPGQAAKKHGLYGVDTGNIIRSQMTPDIKHGKPYMVGLGNNTDHPMLVIPDVVVPK